MRRDYYAVLGITATAAPREIRRAYQRLARQYSPDVNFWDAQARALFDEIAEAYRVLADPSARAMYDRFGQAVGAGGAHRLPEPIVHCTRARIGEHPVRLSDLVEERPGLRVPEVDVRRVLPREPLVGPADLARRSRGRDAQHGVIVATHAALLLLFAQILEIGVHDLTFLRPGRGGLARRSGRARLALRLGLAVHDLRELVR